MGTENRPELPFNHLTIWISYFMQLALVFLSGGTLNTWAPNILTLQDATVLPALLLLKPISFSIIGQEQFSRQRKNVIITYSGEFRKPAPKSILISVKSTKNGHMVIEWIEEKNVE